MPHIHELYDYVVSFFIVYDSKVLLVNHPRYNKWIPPGGHIELNEHPEQALYREIKEETGLTVALLGTKPDIDSAGTHFIAAPRYMDVHDANPPHKHIALVYFLCATYGNFVLSDEHSDMRWLSEKELTDAIYDLSKSVQFYCREAIAAAAQKESTK